MGKVKSKLLLVVLAIMLCFMPMFMFGGCDPNVIEITNVSEVQIVSSGAKKSPHNEKVWINKSTQRITFYVSLNAYKMQLIDYPYNNCVLVYKETDKI